MDIEACVRLEYEVGSTIANRYGPTVHTLAAIPHHGSLIGFCGYVLVHGRLIRVQLLGRHHAVGGQILLARKDTSMNRSQWSSGHLLVQTHRL